MLILYMLREKFILLTIIYLFSSWLKWIFAFGLFVYWIFDKYINHIISSPDYVSCSVDIDDSNDENQANSPFILYDINESIHAFNKSLFCQNTFLEYFYYTYKHITYPLDTLYKKSEYIYLPQTVNKMDAISWYLIVTSFRFIINIPPIKYVIGKIIGFVSRYVARYAITMAMKTNKKVLSTKDKRTAVKLFTDVANNKDISTDKLTHLMNNMMNKLSPNSKEIINNLSDNSTNDHEVSNTSNLANHNKEE